MRAVAAAAGASVEEGWEAAGAAATVAPAWVAPAWAVAAREGGGMAAGDCAVGAEPWKAAGSVPVMTSEGAERADATIAAVDKL